jgi:hypothetical protein
MNLPRASGFALAFLRRSRTVIIATVGLGMLAFMTRRRDRQLA